MIIIKQIVTATYSFGNILQNRIVPKIKGNVGIKDYKNFRRYEFTDPKNIPKGAKFQTIVECEVSHRGLPTERIIGGSRDNKMRAWTRKTFQAVNYAKGVYCRYYAVDSDKVRVRVKSVRYSMLVLYRDEKGRFRKYIP